MIKARCFRCGHAFQLTEQNIANALAAQGITGKPTHYTAECPQCRRVNKISLRRVVLPEPEPTDRQDTGAIEEAGDG
jgi:Zn ribbon nucleic-acid-binding protein